MTTLTLTFDAIAEAQPGPKWAARWERSWPAYEAWFLARGGDAGPSRADCEAALAEHMPELMPLHRRLTALAGGEDRAARFLSTWCPPEYLGGCTVAALAADGEVRLVRNYDLSPELNEGLLLRSAWSGRPVLGMVEFLWGLSDGINASGLSVALAYGGQRGTGRGFGITTILRYILETCATVAEAVAVLRRVPSHMAYNVTLADRQGDTATAELRAGGGLSLRRPAIAANHQQDHLPNDRSRLNRTRERLAHVEELITSGLAPAALGDAFLKAPLHQSDHSNGFGTLFTAVYEPQSGGLTLRWPDQDWRQSLEDFHEGRREIRYGGAATSSVPSEAAAIPDGPDALTAFDEMRPFLPPEAARALDAWTAAARRGVPDWAGLAAVFAVGHVSRESCPCS